MNASAQYQWDDLVYIHGLERRVDLNNRGARVCERTPRADGRVGVEMMLGQERVWIKACNVKLVPSASALTEAPFKDMHDKEIQDMQLFFAANEGSTRLAGIPARIMVTNSSGTRHASQ